MNFFTKLIIVILVILCLITIKDKFYADGFNFFNKHNQQEEVWEPEIPQEEENSPEEQPEEKVSVNIYFTTNTSSSLKKVTREMSQNSTKLEFAVKQLLNGPTATEKKAGYSSEVPKGVKLLGIKDQGSLIIIDLSDEFQYGGGTESQYTRLNQLIKTVLETKPDKPVFLYLNGKKADVIGGEGIMINQPLSETSLNG